MANFVGADYCFDFARIEFTAPDSRMAEIKRVLKPGGQVGIGFWIEQLKKQVLADFKPYQSVQGLHFDKTVAYAFSTKA